MIITDQEDNEDMLVTMKEILEHARQNNYCLPAPNICCEVDARAAIAAAEEANTPLIIDIAYWHHPDFMYLGHLVRQLALQTPIPVAINLDHGKTEEMVMGAFQAGFTSVMCDYSALPLAENIEKAKKVVEFAHAAGLTVESELGKVGNAQTYSEDGDQGLTDPQEAARFVRETGIDALAVAIGTAHGFYNGEVKIDVERFESIKKACEGMDVYWVLHGGSDTGFDKLRLAASHGIQKLNVGHDLWKGAILAVKEYPEYDGFFWGAAAEGFKNALLEYYKELGATNKAWTAVCQTGKKWYV